MTNKFLCNGCDGYGVMTLIGDPASKPIEAPCILCSGNKNLYDLYAIRNKAIKYEWKLKEKKKITRHNERLKAASDTKGGDNER